MRKRAEVTAFAKATAVRPAALRAVEIEQQAHDQRGAESFFRRIDAALDEKRRAHPEGDVEWRDESQIRPISPAEHQAIAQRVADEMRRDQHPLRARRMCGAQTLQLFDKRLHCLGAAQLTAEGVTG